MIAADAVYEKRALAAEYSFVAAVPIASVATGYDLLKTWSLFTGWIYSSCSLPGCFFALFGWLAIKTFIALVGRITLRPFCRVSAASALISVLLCRIWGSGELEVGKGPFEEVGSILYGPPFQPSAPKAFDWGRNGSFPAGAVCRGKAFFGKSYQRITRRALYCSARFFVGSGISTELSNPNRIPFTCAFRKNPFPHCPVRTAVWEPARSRREGRQAGCPVSHPSHR